MTTSTSSLPQQAAQEHVQDRDEIDLRFYISVLWRRWSEVMLAVVAVVLVTAAAILLYRLLVPPVYEATATVAIVRTLTTVQFDERFTTTSEEMSPAGSVDSRRAALIALAENGDIAQQVVEQLGDQLPAQEQDPTDLLNAVTSRMGLADGRSGQSDLISITARSSSPETAAAIANAWAAAFVQQVNSVYGQVPDDMLKSVDAQLVEADVTYSRAQADLESFLTTSKLAELERQVTALTTTLETLQTGRDNALQAYMDSMINSYEEIIKTYSEAQASNQVLVFNKEQEGQRGLLTAYLNAYNAAQIETFSEQSDRQRNQLRTYYEQLLRTNSLLAVARTLQEQATDSESASSTALALHMLQLQLVNMSVQASQTATQATQTAAPVTQTTTQATPPLTPLQIQLDGAATVNTVDLRREVDAVVASLINQQSTLEANINTLSQSLLSGADYEGLGRTVPSDSPLVQTILADYPALFQSKVFSTSGSIVTGDTLMTLGQAQAAQFLDLAETDALPTADSPTAPMSGAIAELEGNLRELQGQIEVERARSLQFTQKRDLAWESVKALSNKQAELRLARAAANSEVRLSSTAIPLDRPVQGISLTINLLLAATVGLLLGIVLAFVLELMNVRPLRQPRQPAY